jgi:hypothetical protein
VDVNLPRLFWKLKGGQNCMLGFLGPSIPRELINVFPFPASAVLRIIDNCSAFLPVVHHDMPYVGAGTALPDALDLVIFELSLEGFEQVDLGTLAKLVGSFLLELTFEVL